MLCRVSGVAVVYVVSGGQQGCRGWQGALRSSQGV